MSIEDRVGTLENSQEATRVDIRDIRSELKLMRAALNSHTSRLDDHDAKLDILIEGQAEHRRLLLLILERLPGA